MNAVLPVDWECGGELGSVVEEYHVYSLAGVKQKHVYQQVWMLHPAMVSFMTFELVSLCSDDDLIERIPVLVKLIVRKSTLFKVIYL